MKCIFIWLLVIGGLSQAQMCLTELSANLSEEQLQQDVTGLELARYLKQSVEWLEPSLPQLQMLPDWFAIESSAPEYELARWLAERKLLVPEWHADSLSIDVWQAMLRKFVAFYEMPEPLTSQDLSHQAVTEAFSHLIDQIAAKLTPVALIASSSQDSSQIGFWAIIRNDSVYPRLIVYRPDTDLSLGSGAKSILPFLSNCALNLKHYLSAKEDVAKSLFLANHNGEMYMVSATPASSSAFSLVQQGQEASYLTYQNPDTNDLEHFAVVFTGQRVAASTVIRLLPRVRTNMNPKQVVEFVLGR